MILGDKEWERFEMFAEEFYGDCLELATKIAGAGNANTTQIMLQQLCPDLLTLYRFYRQEVLK